MSLAITNHLDLTYPQYMQKVNEELSRRVNRAAMGAFAASLALAYVCCPTAIVAAPFVGLAVKRFSHRFFESRVMEESRLKQYEATYFKILGPSVAASEFMSSLPFRQWDLAVELVQKARKLERYSTQSFILQVLQEVILHEEDPKAFMEQARSIDSDQLVGILRKLKDYDLETREEIAVILKENPGRLSLGVGYLLEIISQLGQLSPERRSEFRDNLNSFFSERPRFDEGRRECLRFFLSREPELLRDVIGIKATNLNQLTMLNLIPAGRRPEILGAYAELIGDRPYNWEAIGKDHCFWENPQEWVRLGKKLKIHEPNGCLSDLAPFQKVPLDRRDQLADKVLQVASNENLGLIIRVLASVEEPLQDELVKWSNAFKIFPISIRKIPRSQREKLFDQLQSLGITQVQDWILASTEVPPGIDFAEEMNTFRGFIEKNRADESVTYDFIVMVLLKRIDGEIFDDAQESLPLKENQLPIWLAVPPRFRQLVLGKMTNLDEPEWVFELLESEVIEEIKKRFEKILDLPFDEGLITEMAEIIVRQHKDLKLKKGDSLLRKAEFLAECSVKFETSSDENEEVSSENEMECDYT